MIISLLLAMAIPVRFATARYTLTDSFTSANFDSEFHYYIGPDPNQGYTEYVGSATALNEGLKYLGPDSIYLGVNHSKVFTKKGRRAVRVTSNKAYNHGLFIADIAHLLTNICGVWPALWLLGQQGPKSGEVDLAKGIILFDRVYNTAHASGVCDISPTGFTGTAYGLDCRETPKNRGCAIISNDTESFGKGFLDIGGGVYTLEWTSSLIQIWFFPRYGIPSDIQAGDPIPSKWGLPSANYAGNCDIDAGFQDMRIVISTTFFGAWAGDQWHYQCADKAPTCEDFVANYPKEFENAFWSIKSTKVYNANGEDITGYQRRSE